MRTALFKTALCAAVVILAGGALYASTAGKKPPRTSKTTKTKKAARVFDFTLNSLSGTPVKMSRYKGRVLLIVNTASNCGFTRQYAGLQKLHEEFNGKGLQVLGFPSNDFGGQEPGSDKEIATFCKKNFGVSFPMFAKLSVKGDDKAPFFRYLTDNAPQKGEIDWNFEKFLIGRNGKIVARFKSGVSPESDELRQAVRAELAK